MTEEFKFPDENEPVEAESQTEEIEIVVEDEKPKHSKLREEPGPLEEDEVKQYGEKVRNRIDHLYKGYQTEKRRADDAEKRREEAFQIAKSMAEENKNLKNSLSKGHQALLEQVKKTVANQVDDAKRKYKEAYESGDSEKLVAAQEELTAAKIKLDKVANIKPTGQVEERGDIVPVQPPPDPKAERWKDRNSWFGPDVEMTGFALAYHQKLVQQGVDPTSDDYYEKLDSRLRQVFPENFDAEESPRRSTKSNVAPATRSSAPKKVRLTKAQVDYATKYRIPLERYAMEVAKLQRG